MNRTAARQSTETQLPWCVVRGDARTVRMLTARTDPRTNFDHSRGRLTWSTRIRVHALPTWDSDGCENTRIQDKKGIYEMETTSTLPVVVESGGDQVVAHVGLHALGDFADRLGLGEGLSACIPISSERAPVHDRGKVLVHTSLMLAGGGESFADIEHLRARTDLFGHVASDSTVYRTFHEITPEVRAAIAGGFAQVRQEVWRRTAVTKGKGPIYLDIDASLIEIHSENKQETGPN